MGTLQLELIDFDGQLLWQQKIATAAQALNAFIPFRETVETIVPEGARNNSVLRVMFFNKAGQIICENSLYFTKTKDLTLPESRVKYSLSQKSDHWSIELRTDQQTRNIYLRFEEIPGRFADNNYFDLYPNEMKTVAFYPKQESVELDEVVLSLKHLRDTY